jgi:hypothetical protein
VQERACAEGAGRRARPGASRDSEGLDNVGTLARAAARPGDGEPSDREAACISGRRWARIRRRRWLCAAWGDCRRDRPFTTMSLIGRLPPGRSWSSPLSLPATAAAQALPSDLDPAFSGDGIQTTDFGGADDARGIAVQGDGKIVTVGGTEGRVAVARSYICTASAKRYRPSTRAVTVNSGQTTPTSTSPGGNAS